MVEVDKPYPKTCAGCWAMRCQKCIISESRNVFDYLVNDAEEKRPGWCPVKREVKEDDGK